MTKNFTVLILSLLFPLLIFGQKFMVRGVVTDANSGETLIGATILYGEGKGVVTDMDGRYFIKLEKGAYQLKVSYVGYLPQTAEITVQQSELTQNFQLKSPTLTEVEVVGDVAKIRETPVAFSSVRPIQIQEELASRDIPMILNKTPGVYATQQGGGDGDARINVRGFNQRNLAVMIDGIPVNDMENGWVYWSNWFGLDAVTRNIQVQRGLGASKLALPSVGGTMNIITKGIDANFGGTVKQDVGSDGYLRTSIGMTTGQMKHGFGITVAGSYKQGNGWVDNTWTKGWFGYLRVDKKFGKHILTLSAMGAPQEHAQRTYKKSIATFDKDYAAKLGVDTSKASPNYTISRGIKYNSNWGYLNRWTRSANGERIYQDSPEKLSQSLNYYFKPQISLRDFWRISDKFYLSTIIYTSFGQGGGTSTFTGDKNGTPGGSTPPLDSLGQVNFQTYYNANMTDPILNPKGRSGGILRASVNNHYWYGLLSTFNWEINADWTLSGGLDARTYRGEHYGKVYDLLGGNYFLNNSNKNRNTYDPLYEGDKVYYANDSKVRWGGIFAQAEWKKGNWSAFMNVTASLSALQRLDYFRKMDLVIDGETFTEAVGYRDIFYYNGTQNLTYNNGDPDPFTRNDTVFVIKQSGSKRDTLFIVNPNQYDITSSEARNTRTKWKIFPGFTIKGGANYNIDKRNNIFLNLGYLSKAPRFSNVFNNSNKEVIDAKNETIQAIELGYSFNSKTVSLNVNGYLTKWNNRPLDATPTYTDPKTQDTYSYNVNGINALHKGIEIEFGWKPFPSLQWDHVLAWGDWRWTSGGSANIFSPAGDSITSIVFNAKGVHVGDAAQFQFMESLRWEIIRYLYVSGSMTLFAKNYSNMDPGSLTPVFMDKNGNPRESWELPLYYLVDVNAGYRFTFKRFKMDVRATVLNLLDRVYISDALNNDSYSTKTTNFDAGSAGVYFGIGRTFNASVAISF
ncbi:MAG: TonB-dependent receptor [Bacteroidales bacterium]|nr:TonB-dependent receptor [Bacteroidales bacterium]